MEYLVVVKREKDFVAAVCRHMNVKCFGNDMPTALKNMKKVLHYYCRDDKDMLITVKKSAT